MPTAHFHPDRDKKLKCPCCGKYNVREELLQALEMVRVIVNFPMVVESGTRCPSHNAAVGGEDDSEHLTGEGVDVRCLVGTTRFALIKTGLGVGFDRIGVGSNFIHFGMRSAAPQEVIWTYYPKKKEADAP